MLEHDCPCDERAAEAALHFKSYGLLPFLHEKGCIESYASPCDFAADNYDSEAVMHLLRSGCPASNRMWSFTGEEFDQVLQCFLDLGLPWPAAPLATATIADTGNIEQMKRLIAAGCPWHPSTTNNAARQKNLAMMKLVHENGCPWHADVCKYANRLGAEACLEYAQTHGAPIPSAPALSK